MISPRKNSFLPTSCLFFHFPDILAWIYSRFFAYFVERGNWTLEISICMRLLNCSSFQILRFLLHDAFFYSVPLWCCFLALIFHIFILWAAFFVQIDFSILRRILGTSCVSELEALCFDCVERVWNRHIQVRNDDDDRTGERNYWALQANQRVQKVHLYQTMPRFHTISTVMYK